MTDDWWWLRDSISPNQVNRGKDSKKGSPAAGLEPATPRLEVWCATIAPRGRQGLAKMQHNLSVSLPKDMTRKKYMSQKYSRHTKSQKKERKEHQTKTTTTLVCFTKKKESFKKAASSKKLILYTWFIYKLVLCSVCFFLFPPFYISNLGYNILKKIIYLYIFESDREMEKIKFQIKHTHTHTHTHTHAHKKVKK